MRKRLLRLALFFAIILSFDSCTKDILDTTVPTEDTTDTMIDSTLMIYTVNIVDTLTFTDDINPILVSKCATCHGGFGPGPGDFNEYAVLKARVDDGTFETKVYDPNTSSPMPPGGSPQLTDVEKEWIQIWIDAGAPNN